MHKKTNVNEKSIDRNNVKSREKKKKDDEEDIFMLDIKEDPSWN